MLLFAILHKKKESFLEKNGTAKGARRQGVRVMLGAGKTSMLLLSDAPVRARFTFRKVASVRPQGSFTFVKHPKFSAKAAVSNLAETL